MYYAIKDTKQESEVHAFDTKQQRDAFMNDVWVHDRKVITSSVISEKMFEIIASRGVIKTYWLHRIGCAAKRMSF